MGSRSDDIFPPQLAEAASDGHTPGAGAVAALAAGAAASLTGTVARSSRDWADAGAATAQANVLRRRLTELAPANAEAYAAAVASLGAAGHGGPEERDAQLSDALDRAASVPLEIADAAANVAELAALVAEHGNTELRGDAAVAALLAEGAARAAGHLVAINLGMTPTDERLRRAQRIAADAASASARAVAAAV